MINADKTQPPKPDTGQRINGAKTIPPTGADPGGQSIVLQAGESIAGSYVVHSLMERQGTQSDVYLAKKWGKSYVVKIYHAGWQPSGPMQSFLANVCHPNIAQILEYGNHCGRHYEIYGYYPEGTLEEAGPLPASHIQKVIVPSINEGLRELHRNGIVHCDIKPGNLFYADGRAHIVIGDCGISGYANANGKLVDAVRGTPEYAPRVKALLWSAAMSPAYDYGSFGLVLCRAILGHSLFEGMSVEEIANAWEKGLELPGQISGRLGDLVKSLLEENEDQRWGYREVKKWCEGGYVRPASRNIYARQKRERPDRPLIFGTFDGQALSVSTPHQLAQAIRAHWEQARNIVKRRELADFVSQFDQALTGKIRELARCPDSDAAVYKLLLYLEDDPRRICYCGREYASLADYVEQLSSGRDEIAKNFLSSGLLILYLRQNGYEKSQVDRLELLIRRNGSDDMAAVSTICFALQGKKAIEVFGVSVEALEDLIPVLRKCSVREIHDLLGMDHFIAWMNRLGFEKEMRKMKEEFA